MQVVKVGQKTVPHCFLPSGMFPVEGAATLILMSQKKFCCYYDDEFFNFSYHLARIIIDPVHGKCLVCLNRKLSLH